MNKTEEYHLIQHRGGALAFDGILAPTLPKMSEVYTGSEAHQILLPLDEMNALHIRRALKLAKNKINGPGGTAELLKIHPNTLRKKMDKLRIPYGRKKIASLGK